MQNIGYPTNFIDELKQKNNIVSVISKHLTLDKKGKTYWACCPFHYEKTPSFAINEAEQYYHCFGCGESGDVIKFIEKYENVSFVEAVKMLADSCGMKLPELSQTSKDIENLKIKAESLKACNIAMQFYKDNLQLSTPNAQNARNYLNSRGIDDKIIKDFNIGLSPDWTSLVNFLHKNGIDKKIMKVSGLIDYNENGNAYDFFGNRLIFPILNTYGEPIGFTARTMETNPSFAKYKNSSQSIIFDKSRIVYNISAIRELKKQQNINYVIICEGTIDVIAMYKAGFKNTVACMGTAITSFHAREIRKFTDKVILCLDGDNAGQNAMYKAIDVLLENGLEVKVVQLKDNLDPDEFLKKHGIDALKFSLENSIDAIEYKLLTLANKYNLQDNYQKNKYISEALQIIRELASNAEKEIYLKILSKLVNMSIDILRRDLAVKNTNFVPDNENTGKPEEKLIYRQGGHLKALKFVLASIVHKKDYAIKVVDKNLKFKNSNYQNLFDFVKSCYQNNKSYTISMLFDLFDVEGNEDIKEIIDYDFSTYNELETYFNQCLETLNNVSLKQRQEELTKQFKLEKDLDKRREIAKELSEIAKELKLKMEN